MENKDTNNTEQTNNVENVEVVQLTVIEQALEKENITRKVLDELKNNYSGLTINGIDDVEGLNKVDEARKHCKRVRVAATNICKAGRQDAIKIQSDWIAKEKQIVAEVEQVETALKNEVERIKEEKERILFEAAQKEKLPARIEKLLTIGITVEDSELLKINDADFEKLFNEFYVKHLEDMAAKAKEEAAEKARVEAKRVAAEKKAAEEKAAAEAAEAKRIADQKAEEQRLENERLKKENEEKDRIAKEAKEKADAELADQKRIAAEEKARQDAIIEKQRLENERLAREAKEKADAETKAKQEAEKAAAEKAAAEKAEQERLAKAPDKDKLNGYVGTFLKLPVELELNSEESKLVKQNIDEKFKNFIKWALEQIEKL